MRISDWSSDVCSSDLGSASDDLPDEARPPEVRKADPSASPIMFLVISKPGWDRLRLSDYVDRNIVDRFSSIDGVARVFVAGDARPGMRSAERRVGQGCVSTLRYRVGPYN